MEQTHAIDAGTPTADDYREMVKGPGKFEGEQPYVPYFYEQWMDGWMEDDYEGGCQFTPSPDDIAMWPELVDVTQIHISEDHNGFVYCNITK